MHRVFALFFALLLFSLPLLHAKEATSRLEHVTLQLHWKYQFEFAGFIAAKEKGFYKDAGLDVTFKEYEYGVNIVDEVLSQRATYGIYNSNILVDYLHEQSLLLLASYFKRSALVLITKPQIKSPRDLLGKKIMASGKEDFDLNFKALFERYGVDTRHLEFVAHTYSIDDFVSSDIDAMTAFISDQPYQLDKQYIEYNIINPSDYGTFNLQLELFTSKEEAMLHPQRTQKFRDATNKGWEYALLHQEEMINLIYDKYSKQHTKECLKNEAQEIQKLILPYTYNIGSIDTNFLIRQLEILKIDYRINSTKTIDEFIFDEKRINAYQLTAQELLYLQKHPKITLCTKFEQFPYDWYLNKQYTGIMADIFTIIGKNLDVSFEPLIPYSQEELIQNIKEKKCQVISILPTSTHIFDTVSLTQPFHSTYFTIISKLDKSFIQDPRQLQGKLLLVQFEEIKNYLLQLYPYLMIEVDPDLNSMMQRILTSKAYASVEIDEKADYLIDSYGYGKLKINGFLAKEQPVSLGIGVQKDEAILLSILNKTLHTIADEKIDSILHSWRLSRYQHKTDYSLVITVLIILGLTISIMAYYQRKLKRFNTELSHLVDAKTHELQVMNESLEFTVREKVQELIQKDKILKVQSKQAVMGEMISMIAHQWRQPLSTITLQISNLQIKRLLNDATVSPQEIDAMLSQISDTIIYLSQTVDDFQTYFRTDKESTEIEIHELLQKALNFALPRIKNQKISITIKRDKEIMTRVYINELVQVILNLLNNAIDSFERLERENKEIILEVIEMPEDIICILVKDNGCGIAPANLEHLFEPYFSTKGKNGTGLGLYMSQMIIEKQFYGHIEVESSHEGSTFSVFLHKEI